MGMSSGSENAYSGVTSDINVTPMADIMLVLLIIFMLTIPNMQEGITVNMAKAKNALEEPLVDSDDAVQLTLTRTGEVWLNDALVPDEELLQKLQDRFTEPGKPLFIKSDIAVPYRKVVEIVNKAREAGIERIGLMVDREQAPGAPAR